MVAKITEFYLKQKQVNSVIWLWPFHHQTRRHRPWDLGGKIRPRRANPLTFYNQSADYLSIQLSSCHCCLWESSIGIHSNDRNDVANFNSNMVKFSLVVPFRNENRVHIFRLLYHSSEIIQVHTSHDKVMYDVWLQSCVFC